MYIPIFKGNPIIEFKNAECIDYNKNAMIAIKCNNDNKNVHGRYVPSLLLHFIAISVLFPSIFFL